MRPARQSAVIFSKAYTDSLGSNFSDPIRPQRGRFVAVTRTCLGFIYRSMKLSSNGDPTDEEKQDALPTDKIWRSNCEIGGKRFLIVRHFEGERSMDEVVAELAEDRARREMGL